MKLLLKLILFLLLTILVLGGFIYAANNGKINKPLKHILVYYLQIKGYKAKIDKFTLQDGIVNLSGLLHQGNTIITIDNLIADIDFSGDIHNPLAQIVAYSDDLAVLSHDNQQPLFHSKFELDLSSTLLSNKTDYNIHFSDIAANVVGELKKGNANCSYKSDINIRDYKCNISFGDDKYINFVSKKSDSITANLQLQNIPILLYEIAYQINPESEALIFLNGFIKSGNIIKGNLDLNLDDNFFQTGILTNDNLTGRVKVQGLDLQYADDLPLITGMDIDVDLSGTLTKFFINEAYSSDILISDGIIEMNWQGRDNTKLTINAKGTGLARDLTDFIPENIHDELSKTNINLRKFTGNTNVDINIIIPLKPGSEDIYNIKAELPNTGISILKDRIRFESARLSGLFNGRQLIINGKGEINKFTSDIDFIYNVEDHSKFNHQLDIKTHLKPENRKNLTRRLAFITIRNGNGIVDFNYTNKNSQGKITVGSDLTNLDLYFDKLGMHKQKGKKAEFNLQGTFNDPINGNLELKVTGENNLNVIGNIKIKDLRTIIDFPEITHGQTDLKATMSMYNDELDAKINGKLLDLANADMLQFLTRERDRGTTKFELEVDRVRMKDDIWLDDLKLGFNCSSNTCLSGYVSSKIGSRDIKMNLQNTQKGEQWLIECSNAGALLRSIDAYDSMKAGEVSLTINTNRRKVRAGQVIPIIDGTFSFKRFVLQDTPAISRLVSFVSLPGFLSVISGNKDIVFADMKGQFSFSDNVLTIDNSFATGPYFNFTMKGDINVDKKKLELKGHVTPSLYGVSRVIGAIPLLGTVFTGNKQHKGLVSAPYKIQDSY